MASHFLVKLNFNEIGNEQRSVILVYIIKKISSPWEENAKPFCYWFFELLRFIRISLTNPKIFFILWMVYVVWCNDDDIENVQRRVLFLDIITDAAGRLGDCVHKRCTQGLRRTYSIQKNLKLGPHGPPITHKI